MVGLSPAARGLHVCGVAEIIRVRERGRTIEFTFDDLMRYHGPDRRRRRECVQGAATCVRGAVARRTAAAAVRRGPDGFRGPGARDGFEAVTRAVTDDRYIVDRSLVRSDRGRLREDFVFEVSIGDRTVTLVLRDGFVTEEFIDLARTDNRTGAEESRLDELKANWRNG